MVNNLSGSGKLIAASSDVYISSDIIIRPNNTTTYTAQRAIGSTPLSVTGATNTAPILLTVVAHGYKTGDAIIVSGVGGNTAANGAWNITVIDDDTIRLEGSKGNAAFTSGGSISKLLKFAVPKVGELRVFRIVSSNPSVATKQAVCVLFNELPTTLNAGDNVTIPIDFDGSTGLYLTQNSVFTSRAGATASWLLITSQSSVINYSAPSGYLYGVMEIQGAYTPAANEEFYVELTTKG